MNGIRAKDDYIMAGVYFEADLNNLFFRKTSSCKSYQPPYKSLNKIETQKVPVFSFRYKIPFSKSEEKDFQKTFNVESVYAQLSF